MSLYIKARPSQAGDTIKWTTTLLQADTQPALQALIDALPVGANINTASPQGGAWLADIQYQATHIQNMVVNYSVMIVIGEWNPTP